VRARDVTQRCRAALPALLVCGCLAAPRSAAAAALSPAELPAAGRQASLLTVGEPGRYAITATSSQGASLQLVDRMAGPGEIAGVPGESDGRLDLLLDRGEYRVVARGADGASGTTRLAVRAFREMSAPRPPLLVELKPVAATLGDFEQRSWWIDLREPRRVVLEAAGRNLADLRLWRDGGWLVDRKTVRETLEPEPGRPLRACRLVATLEPGLYLLTAYGGPDEPWAAGGAEHPLHVRFGIPQLPEAGRRRLVVGPFGVDHWLLPGSANYVRLDLPAAAPLEAEASLLRTGAGEDPLAPPAGAETAEITKKNREPFAELKLAWAAGDQRLLTVRAAAGQPYLLQHFERRDAYPIHASGRHWLSSVHSGHPQDSADVTVLVTQGPERRHVEPFLLAAVEVDAARAWVRRCNLLAPLSVIVKVRTPGSYQVLSRGTKARFRMLPLLLERPEGLKEPPWADSGASWDLGAALYLLQAEPVDPGILDIALRPARGTGEVWGALDGGRASPADAVRAAVAFPEVALDWTRTYEARFGELPGVRTGLVLRPLPLDLAQPLPLALRPGEEIAARFAAAEPGVLRAETDDGAPLEIAVDGGPFGKEARAGSGEHTARVRSGAAGTVCASLAFAADRLQPGSPLPELPAGALAALPVFTALDDREPRFFDLEGKAQTFAVTASEPGFYSLETTGLLATSGNLRTRLTPALARADGGGTGRNFAIAEYLRPGDYLLTVEAVGASRGHLGAVLRRRPVREGGRLREGAAARATLAAGEGIAYEFAVAAAGDYRLGAFALGRTALCRLEDGDGWPIEKPGLAADLTRRFEPGRYRLILEPGAVTARVVTLLERVPEAQRREGHGPHALALESAVEHLWLESPEGAERTPDRWEFDLPASALATVTLGAEMQGEIRRRGDAGGPPAARIPPGRAWTGRLEAGAYTLEAVCSRRSNQVPYTVAVRLWELVAGLSRAVRAPAEIPLSVGAGGLVEIATRGREDVRARLTDASGRTVAEQEDRPDDWNVQLLQRLPAGAYRLAIEPAGAAAAATTVFMRTVPERDEAPLPLPAAAELRPGDGALLLPLLPAEGARVLLLRARAIETVGVALEHDGGAGWTGIWTGIGRSLSLDLPLAAGRTERLAGRYRLRVWSLDRADGAVAVTAAAVAPQAVSERDLARGVAVPPLSGFSPPIAVVEAALDRPGVFRTEGAPPWRSSGLRHVAAAATAEGLHAAPGGSLVLVADLPGPQKTTLRATRFALAPGGAVTLAPPPGGPAVACDLDARGAGAVLATAVGAGGQPVLQIVPREEAGRTRPSALAVAVVDRAAAALLADPGEVAALVSEPAGEAAPRPYTLRLVSFPKAAREPLAPGLASGTVAAGAARFLALPRGPSRIRLTLGAGLVAALARDGRPEAAVWASGRAVDETIESGADALCIANPGTEAVSWSLEVLPIEGRERAIAVAPGWPAHPRFPEAGTARLPVAPDDGKGAAVSVHVRGAAAPPTLLGADGRVARGEDLAAGAGGVLLVPHGPGPLVAWADRPGEAVPGLWGAGKPPAERDLAPPETLALKGRSLSLRAKAERPVLLHLAVEEAVVALVRRPQGAAEADVHRRGARIDILLPAGATEIWLRAADGGELRGRLEAALSEVIEIREGLGPAVLLPAGGARGFGFAVERAGAVGVGVRATPDTAAATLLDASGAVIGRGVVQMPTLAPGRYVLLLRAPAEGGPVTVRPALAGVVPPGLGPPDEVVRGYLGMSHDGGRDGGPDAAQAPAEGEGE
jgi:hypothetical protein